MNVSGHNADLALSGLDNAGAVGANQARLTLRLHDGFYSNHIQSGNALSNAHDEVHLCLDGFKDCIGSERWGDVDNSGISPCFLLGFSAVCEDRET